MMRGCVNLLFEEELKFIRFTLGISLSLLCNNRKLNAYINIFGTKSVNDSLKQKYHQSNFIGGYVS